MDAAHALLQPVRIPRDVVVKEDVAALQIDAFTGRFRCDKNLNPGIAELLFREQPRARLLPASRFHAAVNAACLQAPRSQLLEKVIEGVLELREDQKALL